VTLVATPSATELFLTPDERSRAEFRRAVLEAVEQILDVFSGFSGPTTGVSSEELKTLVRDLDVCPQTGVGLSQVLADVSDNVLRHVVNVNDPRYVAHYHSAPLISSLVAEVLISATNQSLDSFDQSPSATVLEGHVIEWVNQLIGYGAAGDGVFTTGATQSNLMGLLLARDWYLLSRRQHRVAATGLPSDAHRFTIVCSDLTHFSISRASHVLGLGEQAVMALPSRVDGTLDPEVVDRAFDEIANVGREPIALVLTAGTTDLGSIDPLDECTRIARAHGVWVHVDAASAGALLLSDTHAQLLRGIEQSDSTAIDFHKWLFQVVPCGVFAVREASTLRLLRRAVPYLNPDDALGPENPNLVDKSLQTTRRFDALKLLLSFRAVGRSRLGELIDQCVTLAREAAELISESSELSLLALPMTNTVLFRWQGVLQSLDETSISMVNRLLPATLWQARAAVIGRTRYRGLAALKLSILNPRTTPHDLAEIVGAVEHHARLLAAQVSDGRTG
jgi:L-2,4-diaminobutyrate decarboxylase